VSVVVRKRRGPRGGRPLAFDPADYRSHNFVERRFNLLKQWRGLAARYIVRHAMVVVRQLSRIMGGRRA